MRKRLLLLSFVLLGTWGSYAQSGDLCGAVGAILRDGPNNFRNVRSPEPDKAEGRTLYRSQIKVPGTFISRFISSMGLFYEGGIKQATTPEALQADYMKYQTMLNSCLSAKGYVMREVPKHDKGLEQYKKILFMPDFKSGGTPPPGHVALDIDYNKLTGYYTLLIYIYEK